MWSATADRSPLTENLRPTHINRRESVRQRAPESLRSETADNPSCIPAPPSATRPGVYIPQPCVACPIGWHKPSVGTSPCLPCPMHQFLNHTGASRCPPNDNLADCTADECVYQVSVPARVSATSERQQCWFSGRPLCWPHLPIFFVKIQTQTRV